MKTYDEKHIKNVVLVGSTKSGKTTLAETMLFEAGLIKRRGTIEEKNTISDYHSVEHERGNSVYATNMHTEWKDYKINIIDTPGLNDFVGEVISSIRVSDTIVFLLNAVHGVEVGSDTIWDTIDAYQKPTIFAVNALDYDNANFQQTVDDAKTHFGSAVTIMQYPRNAGTGFNEIIDLLKMAMYRFPKEGGKPEKLPIPDDEKEKADKLHNELVEKAAENDEALMEKYFEQGNLNEDEMRQGLKVGMMQHEVFPVFCLSAKNDMGSGRLMGFIDNVAPSAVEIPGEKTEDGKEIKCDRNGTPTLFVFKTLFEPHLGKINFFKVLSGEVKTGLEVINTTTGSKERLNQLFIMDGKNRHPIERLVAGDIGATLKLKDTFTNHILSTKGSEVKIKPIDFPSPKLRMAITPKNEIDDEKLTIALQEIHHEDPSIVVEYNNEIKQTLILIQGELHLQLVVWRLKNVYNLDVELVPAKIPYRETIQKPSEASYKHKKQSGGSGQFGEVYMKIEPYYEGMPDVSDYPVRKVEEIELPWGGKLVFVNSITGGAIDTRYLPAIQKGILEKMAEGPLTGSCVRDVRVIVYDGKMHAVDSNDISFKIAGMKAFTEAFNAAQPQLLEPVYTIEVTTPEEMMGDVMSELQTHRSIITGMGSENGMQVIKAHTPLAELDSYTTALQSITQGRAKIRSNFHDYVAVPGDLQVKLTQEHSKMQEA